MIPASPVRLESIEKLRALVVDDSHDSAQTMVWTLEALGYEGAIAHNGAEAFEISRSFKPHVLLLDINLPGMNGYEICQAMRKDPAFRHCVFIAQTGWNQVEHIERSRAAGFGYHLVKPIQLQELKKILESYSIEPEQDRAGNVAARP